jgi:2',3'-cyclic-nucleotide 2'-phosphodiesterase (5'-nucleotidase family)
MVEVMNIMGYAASAVGNHEFDFGLDVLKTRISEAKYPYLSANLRTKDGGQLPADLGIKAYTVMEVNHIKIGIIGLTTIILPELTKPENRGDFTVIDYQQALREVFPSVRSAGADLVIVDGHICADEMETLARHVTDLGIALITGGHCNDLTARKVGDTLLLEGGTRYQNYATATFTYDPVQRKLLDEVYNVKMNTGGKEDPALVEIINRWQAKADAELNVTIGYLKEEISQGSDAMDRLITGAWLKAFPEADIAITNKGGMTNRLPFGDLKLADIIAMMPFDNTIVEVKMKGSDLLKAIQGGVTGPVIGGMYQQGGEWILEKTGKAVQAGTTYHVLINDFMYSGGDNYKLFAQADPDGYNSGIDWRQPVIDWIKAQNSSIDNPLDPAILILGN